MKRGYIYLVNIIASTNPGQGFSFNKLIETIVKAAPIATKLSSD